MPARLLIERTLPSGQTIQIVQGDITAEETDAIVNAANSHLIHGGGVAGAIASKGGPVIQSESHAWVREHGPVSYERPAWTSGGQLHAKYVIHAVGPIWGSGDEESKLAAAIRGSLAVADELHCTSISMPAISTGIFGFPLKRAARVITAALREYFADTPSGLKLVRVVLYDSGTAFEFVTLWEDMDWRDAKSQKPATP
jgi:O-acetyl-ADP-ribose deacetylase (regulator of RNase III)